MFIIGSFILQYTVIPPVVCCLPASDPTTVLEYFRAGHLISPFSPSSSNIFGDWIQLTTLLSSFVFFGTTVAGCSASVRYFFCLFRILLKLDPYQYQRRHILDATGKRWSLGVPNDTTALLRHGIILKYIHYQSLQRVKLVLGKRWSLGVGNTKRYDDTATSWNNIKIHPLQITTEG